MLVARCSFPARNPLLILIKLGISYVELELQWCLSCSVLGTGVEKYLLLKNVIRGDQKLYFGSRSLNKLHNYNVTYMRHIRGDAIHLHKIPRFECN